MQSNRRYNKKFKKPKPQTPPHLHHITYNTMGNNQNIT